jgi:glutamine amidotransferase-like uncharacterized protein
MRTRRSYLVLACCILAATACDTHQVPLTANPSAGVLLFNGAGTSPNDVTAIEALLDRDHLNYSTVNSRQLNQLSASELRKYRLLIVPGGNFVEIEHSLNSSATANVRDSVQNGLNYLGICAGAFFAGNSSGYNNLNLTSGVGFRFYSAEDKGIRRAAVAIALAGAPTLDQYWEDGPQLSGWGAVVGKYPDGTPAIVEGTFGSGWVMLAGVHPEAPEKWRRGLTFTTPVSADHDYARSLIRAALHREPLPHF